MNTICTQCGIPVREGFRFCNVCGSLVGDEGSEEIVEEAVAYSDLMGNHAAALRILTGSEKGRLLSIQGGCTIGRDMDGVSIQDDPTLSRIHAHISHQDDAIVLEDRNAQNGVFLRIRDKFILQDNDIIRAGMHFFLYSQFSTQVFKEEFGTEFYASPMRGERFRLVEILAGGLRGQACTAPDGGIVVGRSEGNFLFADDKTMNPKHFTIRWTQRGGILVDFSSKNGTYVQIQSPTRLEQGSMFFAGETLFRVLQ